MKHHYAWAPVALIFAAGPIMILRDVTELGVRLDQRVVLAGS